MSAPEVMPMKAKLDPKAPGKNGYVYKQQYGVVVICTDEKHQAQVYARLGKLGLKLKVVAV